MPWSLLTAAKSETDGEFCENVCLESSADVLGSPSPMNDMPLIQQSMHAIDTTMRHLI